MSYIETAKLTDIKIDGVTSRDYPDFRNAYVFACKIDGREATEEELDYIFYNMPHVAQDAATAKYF